MSCARRGEAWRSRLAAMAHDPRSVVLAAIGLALLVAGVALDQAALVAIGPVTMLLSVLLSVVSECSAGPSGLSMKFRADDREAAFESFVEMAEPSLRRAATMLCGDGVLAQQLVEEALARSYLHWDGDGIACRTHALCTLVGLVFVQARLGTLPSQADWEGPPALAALSPQQRALIVLHDDQQLDWPTVAGMLDRPVDAVLREAAQCGVPA